MEKLQHHARIAPSSSCIVFGDTTLSFAQVDSISSRCARTLKDARLGHRGVVTIVAERNPCLMISILAVLKSGHAFWIVDPKYPPVRIELCVDYTTPFCILNCLVETAPSRMFGAHMSTSCREYSHAEIMVDGVDDSQVLMDQRDLFQPPAPDQLIYIAFTSGTTGRPHNRSTPPTGGLFRFPVEIDA